MAKKYITYGKGGRATFHSSPIKASLTAQKNVLMTGKTSGVDIVTSFKKDGTPKAIRSFRLFYLAKSGAIKQRK